MTVERSETLLSLRGRFLLVVGSLVSAVMLAVFAGVTLTWRGMILEELCRRAESVTKAFSVPVLDNLIYQAMGDQHVEDLLDSHVHNFILKEPTARYLVITDAAGGFIAGSTGVLKPLDPAATRRSSSTTIRRTEETGWVVECSFPLATGERIWGTLRAAFDAGEARGRIKAMFFWMTGATALTIGLVLVILDRISAKLTLSLTRLTEAMDKYDPSAGWTSPGIDTRDEVGALARHFGMLDERLTLSRTHLIEAQRQVFHAEKLAAIGRLASGVAHEINNPLNGVKNCVHLIRKDPFNLLKTNEYLDLAAEGLDHIAEIVRKLLGFSRRQTQEKLDVDVNGAVRVVLELLRYRMESREIRLALDLGADIPPVKGDPVLLQEVFMNLVMNSFDAVGDPGKIAVSTRFDTRFRKVEILVVDDGCGIPPEIADKVFDPFFTTKDPGRGTGLGLSVSLEIVESLGGELTLSSEGCGRGAEAKTTLPAAGAGGSGDR